MRLLEPVRLSPEVFVEFPGEDIESSIPSRFQRIAAAYPDALALKTPNHLFTCTELNGAANRVAHALQDVTGGGPLPVALMAKDRALLLVSILGVLKAGMFYTIIEPDLPAPRIAEIVARFQPRAIIADHGTLNSARSYADEQCRVLEVGEIIQDTAHLERTVNLNLNIPPESLCSVTFTSGSTGAPKGVMQTHRNLLHDSRYRINIFKLGVGDRKVIPNSLAFAAAGMGAFGALLSGATLYLYNLSEQGLLGLKTLLYEEKITLIQSRPGLYRQLMALLAEGDTFPYLRAIHMGGEPADDGDISLLRQHLPSDCVLRYSFGTTETGGLTDFVIQPGSSIPLGPLPVGAPLMDKKIRVIDQAGQPLGVGQAGEIVVQSRYLSPGYWRDAELTAQVFQRDPSGSDETIYHGGDLGRWRADGMLEFLGRRDTQVKLLGQRVEIGEVEAALRRLPQVLDAVVVPRDDETGGKRLVAYFAPRVAPPPAPAELRASLGERLPAYMLPAIFVPLEALPRLPNGKVNRAALPAPVRAQPEESDPARQPDPVEEMLTDQWKRVLGLRHIGIRDDYFDLGGNSLQALRLMAGIQQATGTYMPPSILLTHPTIAQLATALRGKDGQAAFASLVAIQVKGGRLPLFLMHAKGLSVMFYRDLARRLGSDQPVYGLQPRGLDGHSEPDSSLPVMATHYLDEIRQLQPHGPYFLAGSSSGGLIAFEMAQQLVTLGEAVGLLAMFDTYAPNPASSEFPREDAEDDWQNFQARISLHWDNIVERKGAARWRYVKQKAIIAAERAGERGSRILQGRALSVDAVEDAHLKVQRLHAEARRRYKPEIYPGRLIIFRADHQPHGGRNDPVLGWQNLARDGIEIHTILGYHYTIMVEPRVRLLAEKLKPYLA